jgi:chromatin remodeling complex protein RSC6
MSSNSSSSGIMSAPAPKRVAKKAVAADAAPAPVAAAPVAAAPAPVAAAPKAKRASKAAAATEVAAPAPVVVTSTPVEQATTATVAPVTTLDDDLKAVASNLNSLRETAATLLGQVKKLEKRVHREMKDARKRRRRVKVDENGVEVKRAPSIFERPTQVTAELLTFLSRPAGTLMSRSEVTKAVNEYVKSHGLKNKHDIKPDAPLRKLLAVGESEPLTYFNLQRYLNRHYIKATPVATA